LGRTTGLEKSRAAEGEKVFTSGGVSSVGVWSILRGGIVRGENGAGNLSFVFNPRFGAWFCEVERYNDFGFAQMESGTHFERLALWPPFGARFADNFCIKICVFFAQI
jgi:hypothetical protein